MKILGSASKIILLMFGITACFVYAYAVVRGIITPDVKDFGILAGVVFGYYFGHKGDPSNLDK